MDLELGAPHQLKLSRSGFLESIWASCHSIFALRPAERLDAYNILSLSLLVNTEICFLGT